MRMGDNSAAGGAPPVSVCQTAGAADSAVQAGQRAVSTSKGTLWNQPLKKARMSMTPAP